MCRAKQLVWPSNNCCSPSTTCEKQMGLLWAPSFLWLYGTSSGIYTWPVVSTSYDGVCEDNYIKLLQFRLNNADGQQQVKHGDADLRCLISLLLNQSRYTATANAQSKIFVSFAYRKNWLFTQLILKHLCISKVDS